MSIHTHTASYSRSVIVLAAGKGTRMKSDLPKVMHHAAGRPMVEAVVDAARSVGCTPVVLVIGHGADLVRAHFAGRANTEFVMQMPQLGTGHAVQQALPALADDGVTLVLSGDVTSFDEPLFRARYAAMLGVPESAVEVSVVFKQPPPVLRPGSYLSD